MLGARSEWAGSACRWRAARSNLGRRGIPETSVARGGGGLENAFYDALENRDPAQREAALMAGLPRVIAAAKQHAPAYQDRLGAVRPEDIADRRASPACR